VTWKVPWLSWLAVIVLTVTMVIVYVVPLRYVILVWGLIKLTAKWRHPDAVHHVGLVDFLSRLPSNRQLVCTITHKPPVNSANFHEYY